MKIGLYTISYLGIWYRGEPLPLQDIMRRAKRQGWEGIELDTKRPHAAPMDLSESDRERLRDLAGELGLPICAVSPNCDLSSHVPEEREAMLCYVRECIELAADLEAPLCKVFAAWPGVVVRDGLADYAWTRNRPDPFPQWSGERRGNILTALRELARFAQDQGVLLVLQNHAPVIKGHRDVYDLIEQVGSPALKACIDLPADQDVATDPAGALALGRKVGRTMVHAHYFGQFKRGAHDALLRPVQTRRARGGGARFRPALRLPGLRARTGRGGVRGLHELGVLPPRAAQRAARRHRLRARADRAGPLVHAAFARGGHPVRGALRGAALRQARSMAKATRLADRVAASIPQFRLSA